MTLRVRHWAWNIFCILSLLLFASSVVLWVRSYFVGENIVHVRAETDGTSQPGVGRSVVYGVNWAQGGVAVGRGQMERQETWPRVSGWHYYSDEPGPSVFWPSGPQDRVNFRLAGFQLYSAAWTNARGSTSVKLFAFPLWIFLPAALPPLLWLRRWRNDRRLGFPMTTASVSDLGSEKTG